MFTRQCWSDVGYTYYPQSQLKAERASPFYLVTLTQVFTLHMHLYIFV